MGVVDRLVLLLAWVTTCGLVYLLGFYVGKGTQERHLGLEERVVRLPVTSQPPAEGQRPKSENEFVFYDKLMGTARSGEARVPAKPAAPAVVPELRPAPAAPVPVASKPAAPVAPPGAKGPPGDAAPKPAANPPPSRPSRVTTEAADESPEPPPPATRPPSGPFTSAPPAHPTGPGWTVLANPTRSREEADGLLRQLRGRGYEATLVRVVRDGDTWYRVQVGRFATSEQATEMMHRLREREGVTHVFVASE
jgi:cell division septation protein DedD